MNYALFFNQKELIQRFTQLMVNCPVGMWGQIFLCCRGGASCALQDAWQCPWPLGTRHQFPPTHPVGQPEHLQAQPLGRGASHPVGSHCSRVTVPVPVWSAAWLASQGFLALLLTSCGHGKGHWLSESFPHLYAPSNPQDPAWGYSLQV